MAYTETKSRNGNKYYYRVISVRKKSKVGKKRKYLGVNLNKILLTAKEEDTDKHFLHEKSKEKIEKIKPLILGVLKKYNIRRAGLFGSYARGEQTKGSDIDIIVEYPKGMGFKFFRISLELEKVLKKKVDLLTYGGINPHIKKHIMKDEVKLL